MLDSAAEAYVKLLLATGSYDPDLIDAYYGPPAWRTDAAADHRPLEELSARVAALAETLDAVPLPESAMDVLRLDFLRRHVHALRYRIEMLQGTPTTFDDEASNLYNALVPRYDEDHYERLLRELDDALPGNGDLRGRFDAFRLELRVPPERILDVFKLALAHAQAATRAHIELPDSEEFAAELVEGHPWSAYNWYQGGYRSLIQLNTSLPTYIDRIVDLACHEGYPGHHVYHLLHERWLVQERGWQEFSVVALFCPSALISEGSANVAASVAFNDESRLRLDHDVFFPAAGIASDLAPVAERVRGVMRGLGYASNDVARRFLDGTLNHDDAVEWLQRYAFMREDQARQRLQFITRYRSYVINYSVGEDLVERYLSEHSSDSESRWRVYARLITLPVTPPLLADPALAASRALVEAL